MQFIIFIILTLLRNVQSGGILGVFLYPSRSHEVLAMSLLEELAGKGHEVTMISTFKKDTLPKNFQHVYVDASDIRQQYGKYLMRLNMSMWEQIKFSNTEMKYMVSDLLEDVKLQEWLKTEPTYDVVLSELFSEALLGISHSVNATTISFHPYGNHNALDYLSGNPHPYSYVPNGFTMDNSMGFWQRFGNTYANLFYSFTKHYFNIPIQKRLLKIHFAAAPPLETLIDSVDLHLVNSHPLVETPRPILPNLIPIGGFHLQNPETLSADLKKYLNESKNGIVLCSMGAHLKFGDFPVKLIETIFAAFAQSEYNIIVQYEGPPLSNVPLSVRLMSWLPQRAILSHPNTKLFITHGGRSSYHEAIYYGVPMIGLMTSGADNAHIEAIVNQRFGIRLHLEDLQAETLNVGMKEVVANPTYKKAIMVESQLHRHRAMNPLDKAVFWVEYVIKHKGAKRLKSPASTIPHYQYVLLDVLVVSMLILILLSLLMFSIVKYSIPIYNKLRTCKQVKHKSV